ncbi:MAG: DUF4402 domain-containing protein [Tsuneonella sp.]
MMLNTAALFTAALVAAAATPAAAAPKVATASGKAQITTPAVLQNTQSLEFGQIATGASGGTVTIAPASDTASSVGTVALLGPVRHRAEFVSRAPIGTVFLSALDPSVVLTRSGGSETMTATLTRANGPGLLAVNVFGLPIGLKTTANDQYIYVGGSLTVPAGQAEGAYSGTFELTVSYL